MLEIFKKKLGGLENSINEFSEKLWNSSPEKSGPNDFNGILKKEITEICGDCLEDEAGNLTGILKGFRDQGDILVLSKCKSKNDTENNYKKYDYRYGITSGLYSLALLERTLLPLTGNIIFACINDGECPGKNIKFLFDNTLKDRNIKTVILCEPTGYNVYIGSKGRLEYEIVIKGLMDEEYMAKNGINMLGIINPLLVELEKMNRILPRNYELGSSSIKVKDVKFNDFSTREKVKEFHVLVDRFFVPEEDGEMILEKARTVARAVFPEEKKLSINASIVKDRTLKGGNEILVEKEVKPWKMESHNPVVLKTLEALQDAEFNPKVGYWKHTVTDGSYTFGMKNIPTIGFGYGNESSDDNTSDRIYDLDEISNTVFGLGVIIHRLIGLPTFGWCEDEI